MADRWILGPILRTMTVDGGWQMTYVTKKTSEMMFYDNVRIQAQAIPSHNPPPPPPPPPTKTKNQKTNPTPPPSQPPPPPPCQTK